jgi:hypothetical protein
VDTFGTSLCGGGCYAILPDTAGGGNVLYSSRDCVDFGFTYSHIWDTLQTPSGVAESPFLEHSACGVCDSNSGWLGGKSSQGVTIQQRTVEL